MLEPMKDHSFSTWANVSKQLAFLTPWYAHVHNMLLFKKILRTYYMNDDPGHYYYYC